MKWWLGRGVFGFIVIYGFDASSFKPYKIVGLCDVQLLLCW